MASLRLRPVLARQYITKLSEMFYDDGYGLLFGRNVKELFYEYRSQLYGILLKSDCIGQGDERIELQNEQLIARLKKIYAYANEILRENLKNMEE